MNKEQKRIYNKAYNKAHKKQRQACKKEKQVYDKARYKNNIERFAEYRRTHKKQIALSDKKCRKKHKKRMQIKKRLYENKRWKTVPMFKLNSIMGASIRKSILGNKNGKHWETLVGYTLKQLKKHLEKQFAKGMTWANYGEWHIDHKIPKSVFNFTKPEHEDFKRCWALKNLQPMWAIDNIAKNNKIEKHFQPSLLL